MKERAVEKLRKELENAKEKAFAEPIINHLIARCNEDEGLAEDVLQEKKCWSKCFEYLYKKAQETIEKGGRAAAIWYEVVYEWAEDYFHMEDVEVKEEKPLYRPTPSVTKPSTTPVVTKASKPEAPKKKGEVEGQLDMFALFGM